VTPPPPNNIRVRLHDVALRYDRARRRRGNTINFIGRQRLRDLGRLFHHRYGSLLPDDDSGREDLAVALDHIVRRLDCALLLPKWVRSWAPWIDESELETMIEAAGRTWTATDLGTHLGLTDEERTELEISTIAPRGLTKAEWDEIKKSRKRKRDRDAKRCKRAEAKAARGTPNSRQVRADNVRSLLSPDWMTTDDLVDLVTIFPGFDLPRDSRRRAVNRIIHDLARANDVEISGPRDARLIREVPSSNDDLPD
jgi:hypothetical protein